MRGFSGSHVCSQVQVHSKCLFNWCTTGQCGVIQCKTVGCILICTVCTSEHCIIGTLYFHLFGQFIILMGIMVLFGKVDGSKCHYNNCIIDAICDSLT